MLQKENRLTKEKDFNQTFRKGKSFFTKIIGIKALKNNLNISRFGVIVSLKISKKAVKRNRIKRQIREIFRLNLNKIKPGYDFIIIALPEIIEKKYKEIEENIFFALSKIKALQ